MSNFALPTVPIMQSFDFRKNSFSQAIQKIILQNTANAASKIRYFFNV